MKRLSLLLALLTAFILQAQDTRWKGYFSYNEIRDLSQSTTSFYAASENAIFSKNVATGQIKISNTVDGLSGQTITAIYHSTSANKTMIGYDNGLIIIINEADGSLLNVVDIINKQLPNNIKRVNHLMEVAGVVYISCDFGIVQYNLPTNGFGDTYFIGNGGAEISVRQTAVFDGYLYAATVDGVRRALIDNPNLIDFAQWSNVAGGDWSGIATVEDELAAVTSFGQLNRWTNSGFVPFASLPMAPVDLRSASGHLLVTTPDRVYIYNETLAPLVQIDSNLVPEMDAEFTAATMIGSQIVIGTRENGVLVSEVSNPNFFENISPDGPIRNNIFSINTESSNLWAVYGSYTVQFDPAILQTYGISKFNGSSWLNIPYEEVHEPGKEAYDLVRVTVNPEDENNIFVSSYSSGLLEFQNDVLVMQYDQTNSGLESLQDPSAPSYISVRIEQSAYDSQGNLWMTNGLLQDPLKVLRTDGTWQSYDMTGVLNSFFEARFGKLVIDKNDTKWMATTTDGVIGFNEDGNTFKKITFGSDNGNLPSPDVRALAIDNRNQLWIGTRRGLRVLPSVDRFQNQGQLTANAIIILEDDVAQELLFEQFITDIAVDGANNKWVATADSGVFLLSPNGQETIHRFTSSNSPLPSNTVNDIGINMATGEVFFATDKGMVSFKGTATGASDNLSNVIVYPNPVRPEFNGTVKITGLLDRANIKIADIEGNLVYETISEGGTIEWDTTAFGKYRVASGVYMIFISAEDGGETKVKKVMVIR